MREIVQVELPDGQIAWATIESNGVSDVGLGARLLPLTGLSETLSAVATNVRNGVRNVRPDNVSVELGLDLEIGSQGLVAALAGSAVKAALKVTLTWTAPAPHAAASVE
ncbi:CU044_2847 family protein [Micromonospora humi]|uniref:Trypsin-co-occurring domain-containing protein n=1 Tax=Micromonospora humi TaxID=745366 RepID=A0A1C5GSU0_9ACTN|nr:CU044_2847 family protein [Micromonospora humi]SCG36840.1 hypothetical protein GA0070213_101511 [Micromonospora humi]